MGLKFYKIELVMEATNFAEAEYWYNKLVEQGGSVVDIYQKDIRKMTDQEIFEFFGRTRKQLENFEELEECGNNE